MQLWEDAEISRPGASNLSSYRLSLSQNMMVKEWEGSFCLGLFFFPQGHILSHSIMPGQAAISYHRTFVTCTTGNKGASMRQMTHTRSEYELV